jgi:hypothetical protein
MLCELEESLGYRLPNELRSLPGSCGHDSFELLGDAVIELHQELLHMIDHIIEPVDALGGSAVIP